MSKMNKQRARAHGLMQPRPRHKPQRPGQRLNDAEHRRIERWGDKWLAEHATEVRAIDKREQRRGEALEAERIARHNAKVRKERPWSR
jgi:hypothetical protein